MSFFIQVQLNEKHIVCRLMCHAKKPLSLTRRALEPSTYSKRFREQSLSIGEKGVEGR